MAMVFPNLKQYFKDPPSCVSLSPRMIRSIALTPSCFKIFPMSNAVTCLLTRCHLLTKLFSTQWSSSTPCSLQECHHSTIARRRCTHQAALQLGSIQALQWHQVEWQGHDAPNILLCNLGPSKLSGTRLSGKGMMYPLSCSANWVHPSSAVAPG